MQSICVTYNASMNAPTNPQHGRRRLIEAALNLSYHKRSFSSLGIREVAREAGLSAPAFYRHFEDLADLGAEVIKEVEAAVIEAFMEVRKSTANEDDLDIRPMLIRRFFEWAAENPKHIVVGASEAFGALERMREGVRTTCISVARDIVSDRRIAALLPPLPADQLEELMYTMALNVFFQAVDYVEKPQERQAIYERTLRLVALLFAGAHALTALQEFQADQSNQTTS